MPIPHSASAPSRMKRARFRLGVDVGGTFTDFMLIGPGGAARIHKELSTPADPSVAVIAGLETLARAEGIAPARFIRAIGTIVHGTTVTTNAVLTGGIARTGLLTTRGFRDALQMRRRIREEMYDNRASAPTPPVPRHLRLGITERIDAAGEVLTALDETDLERAIDEFAQGGVEAVAVCFMHAHANPRHEAAAARRVRQRLPQAYLSVSSQVLPQVRFYQRTSTTVMNAAVGPILARYLTALSARLAEAGFGGVLLVMQSNGGVAAPAAAARLAASTLLSGPAAAPAAGLACLSQRAERSFITTDMGGTSFDCALVRDGLPAVTTAGTVNRFALALPSMDINTIGAGGGSIGWLDAGGLLHMGPQSAGAEPGPACYGRGGTAPTCTDSSLVLGYLSADYFAGGRIRLDADAGRGAIGERITAPLAVDAVAAALGMFRVINVNMAAAIREISVQKGHDPREFPLICAGVAGPVHGAFIAAELGIPRVLVPRDASILCASGMLRSDFRHDYVRSHTCALPEGASDDRGLRGALVGLMREMAARADQALRSEGIAPARQRLRFALDLRYAGQHHEITVDVPRAALARGDWVAVRSLFDERHDALYGYRLRGEGAQVEMLNVRLVAIGLTPRPGVQSQVRRGARCGAALKRHRNVCFPGRGVYRSTPVYDGDALGHGQRLRGPAVVEFAHTTIVVPSGWAAGWDALGNCELAMSRARRRVAA